MPTQPPSAEIPDWRTDIVASAVQLCPLASSVQSVTVRAVTPDHSEAPQYHVLPKDDAEAVVDIMRAAAGLPPLYGEPDDEGG